MFNTKQMETENENSEETKNQKQTGEQPEWMKGQMGQIISILNQPAIAAALASLGLYFAVDPKAIKNALDEVQQSNIQLIQKMHELIEENVKIKKQLKKLANREDENEVGEGQMNGYRKAGNGSRTIFLD